MSALAVAASHIEAAAAKTRREIEAEHKDGFSKLVLLAEYTALLKVAVALREAASCDTHPKGGDVKQAPSPMSGAVGEAETPNPIPIVPQEHDP